MLTITTPVGPIYVREDGTPQRMPVLYGDIIRFDLRRFEKDCNALHVVMPDPIDIDYLGFWTDNGYVNPIRSIECGFSEEYEEFDADLNL